MKKYLHILTRLLLSLTAAVMLGALMLPAPVLAEGDFDPTKITSESFVLMDGKTGEVLSSKEPDKKIYPASTTKVMTALLLLENKTDLNEKITVGDEVNPFSSSSSLMGLVQNETVTIKDLLYGMMMVSGNDAANASAVAVAGSLTDFSKKMNDKANELGMTNTQFKNAHGLKDEEHYSTAKDMVTLARAAMQNETFREVVKSKSYTWGATNMRSSDKELKSTNKLITGELNGTSYVYEYATGIKTGLTPGNGCLLASAEKDGRELIVAIMGDTSNDDKGEAHKRWSEAREIFDYGFSAEQTDITNLVNQTELKTKLEGQKGNVKLKPVLPGDKAAYAGGDSATAEKLKTAESLTATITLNEGLNAPYEDGQVVGKAEYKLDGTTVFTCDVAVAGSTSDSDSTNNGGDGKSKLTENRTFMIVALSLALLLIIILFFRILTAPRRRRRRRSVRRRRY